MLRFFLTLTVLVATLTGAVAAVEAQSVGVEPTTTETPVPEETTTVSLSPTTQVDSWRFDNSTFYVTISSEIPTRVTLTDAGKLSAALSEEGGAATTTVRQRTVNIVPGKQTVEFRATEHDGASAITLSAVNGDGMALIRTDSMGGDRRPVEWQTTAALVLLAAAGAAYWTYREAKKRWEDEKKEVSRIA